MPYNWKQTEQNQTNKTQHQQQKQQKRRDLVLAVCVKDDRLVFVAVRRSVQMDMQYQSALSQKTIWNVKAVTALRKRPCLDLVAGVFRSRIISNPELL